MKRRTQTILLLAALVCIIYFWDIISMLSYGMPDSESSYPKSVHLRRKSLSRRRNLAEANSGNDSWRKPRWSSKKSVAEEAEERQYNKFKGPKSKKKKRVGTGNNTSSESWHPKALVQQNKNNKGSTDDADTETAAKVPVAYEGPRYLLPITLGNQGPNNQLQSVKFCVAVALMHNYTLVLPPFFEHQSNKLQTLPRQRTFEETMDWQALYKILPVISLEGFRTMCSGNVQTVMTGTAYGKTQTEEEQQSLEEYEDEVAQVFGTLTQITIPSIRNDTEKVLPLPDGTPKHFIHVEDYIERFPAAFNSTSMCNAFVHPYGMLGRFGYRHFNSLFSEHFIRAEYIRTFAEKFITQFMGQRFMCIHWRFDQEWVDFWCTQEHGRYYCPILQKTPITQTTQKLRALLQQQQINVVYYASPIDQEQDGVLGDLRKSLQYLFTRANILSSSIAGIEWFQGDNYRLSLLEQEICKRSEFFIASELSSWSDMVIEDRQGVSVMRATDVIK